MLAYRAGLVAHLRSMGEWERALAPRRRSRAALKDAEDVWDLLSLQWPQALVFAC